MNMRTTKQLSEARHKSKPTAHTSKLPPILEQIRKYDDDLYLALGGGRGIFSNLWKAIRIEIPSGYQDEEGFHLGVDAAKSEVKSHRSGPLVSRRRVALFHPFHNIPLGWQAACALASQRNKVPSAHLLRRRDT
jgi:hypothetical protein